MTLRIIYSGVFIQRFFKVHFLIIITNLACFVCDINLTLQIFLLYGQDSPSFSFYKCFPSGWTVLLFSGITTLISERLFLDRENFWLTFPIHFSIGFACFCLSSFVMYLSELLYVKLVTTLFGCASLGL